MQVTATTVESVTTAEPPPPEILDALFKNSTCEVVWSGLLGGAAVWVSASCDRVTGFSVADMLSAPGNIWLDRAHPADAARIADAYRTLGTSGTAVDVEYRWQRRDQTWIWLRGHAVLRGGSDAPIVDAFFVDVSTQKRLEEQVRQLQKVEAIGQFTGGIAHDFNNLLAVILANATLLLDALHGGDARRADAEAIVDAANRAAELTKQLLAFNRKHLFEPRVLDLNDLVTNAERMLRRVLSEDVDLTIATGPRLGHIRADATLIEQVLMNLVLNACDAMPHGGKLSIQTSAATAGRVQLTVSDTGCGMDAETRRRVFEPYFTTKESGRGTGLGLSTCLGVVKQAGGTIQVYSEPGRGSLFEVLLPAVRELPRVDSPTPVTRADYAGTETILVVEDEAAVRSLVERMLSRLGYRVICARDGQEAFAILHSADGPIDLVLCDVVMPDLAGPAVVARVQTRSPRTRALFMSGHTTHFLVKDGTLQEGHAFIRKPFVPSALAVKIREVLDA